MTHGYAKPDPESDATTPEPPPSGHQPGPQPEQPAAEPVAQDHRAEWGGWMWTSRGRNVPWLGILLVLIGISLLVQTALTQYGVTAGTVLLFAIGLALVAGWLFGGSWLAGIPGLLLLALGVANLIRELRIYTGPGTTALTLAIAFVVIWLIGLLRQGRRSNWPLWAAAILGLIGAVQVAGQLQNIPELAVVWPVVIIIVGLLLLISSRRSTA